MKKRRRVKHAIKTVEFVYAFELMLLLLINYVAIGKKRRRVTKDEDIQRKERKGRDK